MNKAVFLDRDGTLIKDAHYLKDPGQIEIINGVIYDSLLGFIWTK